MQKILAKEAFTAQKVMRLFYARHLCRALFFFPDAKTLNQFFQYI
jgi:hypothetical protein